MTQTIAISLLKLGDDQECFLWRENPTRKKAHLEENFKPYGLNSQSSPPPPFSSENSLKDYNGKLQADDIPEVYFTQNAYLFNKTFPRFIIFLKERQTGVRSMPSNAQVGFQTSHDSLNFLRNLLNR